MVDGRNADFQRFGLLFYWCCRRTAIRGKRLVVPVGQRKAIAIAVHNVSVRRRWSKLKEWLGDRLMDRNPKQAQHR